MIYANNPVLISKIKKVREFCSIKKLKSINHIAIKKEAISISEPFAKRRLIDILNLNKE